MDRIYNNKSAYRSRNDRQDVYAPSSDSTSASRSGGTDVSRSGSSSESHIDESVIDLSPRGRSGDTASSAEDAEKAVSVMEQSVVTHVDAPQGGSGCTNAIALGSFFSFGAGIMIGMPFAMLLLKDMASQAAAIGSGGVIGLSVGGVVMSAMYQNSLNSRASAQSPA